MKLPKNRKWTNSAEELNRRIENNFQGRKNELEIFHRRTNWLIEHMHQDCLVTNYYGLGGIGKTSLLRKIMEEATNQKLKYACYEFNDSVTDPAAVILYLAYIIGNKYGGHIWDRTIDLLKQCGVDGSILEQDFSKTGKIYDSTAGIIDTGITTAVTFRPDVLIIKAASGFLKGYKALKSLRKNGMTIAETFDRKDTSDTSVYSDEKVAILVLTDAFAADLELLLGEADRPLVIILDALDRYYKQSFDDEWIKQLIRQTNDVHWVLSGRDQLNWKEEEWTMKASETYQHLFSIQLDTLSKEETEEYFLKAEVVKENDQELMNYLYQLTDGIPLYMYLCVDIYVNLENHGKEASVENFDIEITDDNKHKVHTKLIERWADEDADKIREFAALYKWNDEILKDSNISLSPSAKDWYAQAKEKSIFQYDQQRNCSFHDVIQEVIISDALNKEMYGFINHMQANAEYFLDDVKLADKDLSVIYTGMEVLLYYLNLKNKKWHNETINIQSLIYGLFCFCNWLDSIGDWNRELELSERLLVFVENTPDFEETERGKAYSWYALANTNLGKYPTALEYYEKDLEICERVLGHMDSNTAQAYDLIGGLLHKTGNLSESIKNHREAVNIYENVSGCYHIDTAKSYNNLGHAYMGNGDFSEAIECFKKALKVVEKDAVRKENLRAIVYSNMGMTYFFDNQNEKALDSYQKALNILESVFGPDHPNSATILDNISGIYRKCFKYSEALEYSQRAAKIYEDNFGPYYPELAITYDNIAGTWLEWKNEYFKGLEYYQKALKVRELVFGYYHPETAQNYVNIARLYEATDDLAKDLMYYWKTLCAYQTVYGEDNQYTKATRETIMDRATLYLYKNNGWEGLEPELRQWLEKKSSIF